jgi:hypothetical protein
MEKDYEYISRSDEITYKIPDWLWEKALSVKMNNYLMDALLIIRKHEQNRIQACEVHNRLRILYPNKYSSLDRKYDRKYEEVKRLNVIKAQINTEMKFAKVPLRIRQDSLKKYSSSLATVTYHAVHVKEE